MRWLPIDLLREIRENGLFDTAASVAFWLLLSLPAALLAVLSSVSLLGDDLTDEVRTALLDFVDRTFGNEAEPIADSIESLFAQPRPAVFSLAIATAIFSLSRGFAGLIRGLDTVYDVEETRNFAHTRALGIGLGVGTLGTVAASTAMWSATGGWPEAPRLIGALAVLILWAAMMYHIGPNHHTPWRFDLPGALLSAAGWLTVSLGFRWYISLLGTGNELLGAAGAILLGLTWLWAACVVFLIGGELNELLAARAGVVSTPRSLVRHIRSRIEADERG
jgi:membrane protein